MPASKGAPGGFADTLDVGSMSEVKLNGYEVVVIVVLL